MKKPKKVYSNCFTGTRFIHLLYIYCTRFSTKNLFQKESNKNERMIIYELKPNYFQKSLLANSSFCVPSMQE